MTFVSQIAESLASQKRPLSLSNEHRSHSEYLMDDPEARAQFGRAVGCVLQGVQQSSLAALAGVKCGPALPRHAQPFLTSHAHRLLDRCIATLARRLPYCVESMTLALCNLETLQHRHEFVVNSWTLNRLFATALVVASKFSYDCVYSNKFYASLLGLTLSELNDLELSFLALFDFAVAPEPFRWIQMHCIIARIAFEPTVATDASFGAVSTVQLPPIRLGSAASKSVITEPTACAQCQSKFSSNLMSRARHHRRSSSSESRGDEPQVSDKEVEA